MTRWIVLFLCGGGFLAWVWARRARIDRPLTPAWRRWANYDKEGDVWFS